MRFKLLGGLLKSRIEIPFVRIRVVSEGEKRAKDYTFYRSALIVGKKSDCDVVVGDPECENISIERRGVDYFLSKGGGSSSPGEGQKSDEFSGINPIKLLDNDEIELGASKLKVSIAKISLPVCSLIIGLSVVILMILYGTFKQGRSIVEEHAALNKDYCINSAREVEKRKAEKSETVSSTTKAPKPEGSKVSEDAEAKPLPKPAIEKLGKKRKKATVIRKTRKKPKEDEYIEFPQTDSKSGVKATPIKRVKKNAPGIRLEEVADIFCRESKTPSEVCLIARDLNEKFVQAKGFLISGTVFEAKKCLLESLRLAGTLFGKTDNDVTREIETRLAEIYSHECALDIQGERYEPAKNKCEKALSHDAGNTKARKLLDELEEVGRKYFLKAYVLEHFDLEKAKEFYGKVLQITSRGSINHSKAMQRIEALKSGWNNER